MRAISLGEGATAPVPGCNDANIKVHIKVSFGSGFASVLLSAPFQGQQDSRRSGFRRNLRGLPLLWIHITTCIMLSASCTP